jgi:hypothetical protein
MFAEDRGVLAEALSCLPLKPAARVFEELRGIPVIKTGDVPASQTWSSSRS